MKLIKLPIPIGLAIVLSIALLGPSAAMAETTALCKANETPCAESNQISSIHLAAEIEVLTGLMNYRCEALFSGTVLISLTSAGPWQLHLHELQ